MSNKKRSLFIRDIGKISMCKRVLKEETSEFEQIPFYKISTFGEQANTFISNELYVEYKTKYSFPKKSDILISAAGTVGKTVIYNGEPAYFQDSNIVWVDNDETKIINSYLYYYFQTKPWLTTNGSTITRIYNENLRSIKVTFPESTYEQQKIAKVLSDLDSKIEINNRINTELEALAKTLYDYWFVQFDFPDAKGKPYKTSGGKMVWNEELKRDIPKGWANQALEQIVEIISGNVSPNDIDINTPYIGLEHIPRRTIVLSEWETAEKINSDKCVFKKHDILFGKIRPYFHKVGIAFIDGITSTDTIVLRPRENSCQGFALETVFADDFVETATNSSTGSKMPRANWNILKNYKIAIPPKKILDTYQLQFNNIIKKIELSVLENQELSSLRDWLLPMLMNGQVSIGDEKNIDEREKQSIRKIREFIGYPSNKEVLGKVAEEREKYGK